MHSYMLNLIYNILYTLDGDINLSTTTLSIRIRKDLKEKMKKFKNIDWRREIEQFIEEKIRELELEEILNTIDNVLKDIPPSKEPAWKTIREMRESR